MSLFLKTQKPAWQVSTQTRNSSTPSHYEQKHTLLSDGQGQKLFDESFNYRSQRVPTLFKESVFVGKRSKHQLDTLPFLECEREWERKQTMERRKLAKTLQNNQSSKVPLTSRARTAPVKSRIDARRSSSPAPVVIRDRNISTRRADWRKYKRAKDPRSAATLRDYSESKQRKWNNGTSLSLMESNSIFIEEPVQLVSGRTRVQKRQKSTFTELDRISLQEPKPKLKRFVKKKYPSLVERMKRDMNQKRSVLKKTRNRTEEFVRFGGASSTDQHAAQQYGKKPQWKQSMVLNRRELASRDRALLEKSLKHCKRRRIQGNYSRSISRIESSFISHSNGEDYDRQL